MTNLQTPWLFWITMCS